MIGSLRQTHLLLSSVTVLSVFSLLPFPLFISPNALCICPPSFLSISFMYPFFPPPFPPPLPSLPPDLPLFSPPVILLTAVLQLLRITVGKRRSFWKQRENFEVHMYCKGLLFSTAVVSFKFILLLTVLVWCQFMAEASLYCQVQFGAVMINLDDPWMRCLVREGHFVSTSSLSPSSHHLLLFNSAVKALFFVLSFLYFPPLFSCPGLAIGARL